MENVNLKDILRKMENVDGDAAKVDFLESEITRIENMVSELNQIVKKLENELCYLP